MPHRYFTTHTGRFIIKKNGVQIVHFVRHPIMMPTSKVTRHYQSHGTLWQIEYMIPTKTHAKLPSTDCLNSVHTADHMHHPFYSAKNNECPL